MTHTDKITSKRKRLVENEKNLEFPRGGGNILTPLEQKQIHFQATQDVLFEHESYHDLNDVEDIEGDNIKRRKKSKKEINPKKNNITERDKKTIKIESLNYKVQYQHLRFIPLANNL